MNRLWIPCKKGQLLAALEFLPVRADGCTVIVCHGFRGRKENSNKICRFASRLTELGATVLAFDFQGSGESPGEFRTMTLSRQAEDLRNVIDFAARRYEGKMFLLGRSFGGSTILAAAAGDDRVAGCIFWSTPVHLYAVFAAILGEQLDAVQSGSPARMSDDSGEFELQPGFLLDLAEHNVHHYLEALQNKAVLIIHGQEDEVVHPGNASYMHSRLARSDLHLVPGADHRFQHHTVLREDLTIQWLSAKLQNINETCS